MSYETDERLKSYLDSNQLSRERLCLAVLMTDKRFSHVRPRHPRGGQDGGGDIDAVYQVSDVAIGAVGFRNQATDSAEDKRAIKKKFKEDVEAALENVPKPTTFVFFTNVNLTRGEKDELTQHAGAQGFSYTEIFDRERLRIALDSDEGLSTRFQLLKLPLSEAEQASFFARWGNDIQTLISQGFGEMQTLLNRMQFLHESTRALEDLSVLIELNGEYSATEIPHVRAFCFAFLVEPAAGFFDFVFGQADNADRLDAADVGAIDSRLSGYSNGFCHGQWIRKFPPDTSVRDDEKSPRTCTSSGTSVGRPKIRALQLRFSQSTFVRLPPYLRLSDLDEAKLSLHVNKTIADKIARIHFFANEYKLAEYERSSLSFDKPSDTMEWPMLFTEGELQDAWVRVMNGMSPFIFRFAETTPVRLVRPREIIDTLRK